MIVMLSIIGAIFCFGMSYGQYHHTQHFHEFRASPVDHLANLRSLNNYNPSEYSFNFKAPTFRATPNNQYLPQASSQHSFGFGNFNVGEPTQPLFTPADHPYPAETAGQIEAYNKALEEEQQEALNLQNLQNPFYDNKQFTSRDNLGQSYVSVQFGGPNNVKYEYSV